MRDWRQAKSSSSVEVDLELWGNWFQEVYG